MEEGVAARVGEGLQRRERQVRLKGVGRGPNEPLGRDTPGASQPPFTAYLACPFTLSPAAPVHSNFSHFCPNRGGLPTPSPASSIHSTTQIFHSHLPHLSNCESTGSQRPFPAPNHSIFRTCPTLSNCESTCGGLVIPSRSILPSGTLGSSRSNSAASEVSRSLP